eukprot:1156620-Pelagomonas_calceolata.AAC.12
MHVACEDRLSISTLQRALIASSLHMSPLLASMQQRLVLLSLAAVLKMKMNSNEEYLHPTILKSPRWLGHKYLHPRSCPDE